MYLKHEECRQNVIQSLIDAVADLPIEDVISSSDLDDRLHWLDIGLAIWLEDDYNPVDFIGDVFINHEEASIVQRAMIHWDAFCIEEKRSGTLQRKSSDLRSFLVCMQELYSLMVKNERLRRAGSE